MRQTRNTPITRAQVNWTVVVILAVWVLILTTVGPLVWRVTVQMTEEEAKLVGIVLLFLLVLLVFVGCIIGAVAVYAYLVRQALEQDDADENRKQAQAAQAHIRALEQGMKAQMTQQELFQSVQQRRQMITPPQPMVFTDMVGDVELE